MNDGRAFEHQQYLFRRKFFKLFGGAFHVYDEKNALVFYGKQKSFRLKEDFRVYSDESMKEELLVIKTPQIFDVWATYTVTDAKSGQSFGSLKRKALMSMFRDEWEFTSPTGEVTGKMTEKSLAMALLSRLIPMVPQTYVIVANGSSVQAHIKRHFNPFILKYTMDIEQGAQMSRQLMIAAGILLAGIEKREG